jgi:NAD(P)-dependent dehydrogenase (short-subunit alcohol dehydrogenase family)
VLNVVYETYLESNTLPKTWFITGTSSGFGRTLTEKLLARGDRVAATLRKVNVLDDLKAQHGDDLWVASLDVTDAEAVRRVVDRAFATMGRIDVVVNNAAYGLFGAAEEVSDDQIRHQIDTNLIGSIQVIRTALPHLRAQGGGRVLQVSSEGGQIAYPNSTWTRFTHLTPRPKGDSVNAFAIGIGADSQFTTLWLWLLPWALISAPIQFEPFW